MLDSFGARSVLRVGNREYEIFRLDQCREEGVATDRACPFRFGFCWKTCCGKKTAQTVTAEDIRCLADLEPARHLEREIAFMPGRVLLQDFTGVPAVVDLAAMRDAMAATGRRPRSDQPAAAGRTGHRPLGAGGRLRLRGRVPDQRRPGVRAQPGALRLPALGPEGLPELQGRAARHRHRPPGQPRIPGPRRLRRRQAAATAPHALPQAYPDTLVGTDSHTTMINGLGVLGWGVGGIEAEAAMLGQPVSMLIPQVVGFRLTGKLREGATATDLVLTVTEMLRKKGVVGKFVEFYGPGLPGLPLADRATIANMAPEYGATCGIFPVDAETLRYLRFTGRPEEQVALVEAYMQGAGPVPHRRHARSRVLRHAGTGPEHGRAEPRRAEAPAGPRAPWPTPSTRSAKRLQVIIQPGGPANAAQAGRALGRRGRQPHRRRRRGHDDAPRRAGAVGQRRSSRAATTAPSSSPPSPVAPTPPTPRSWSPPGCWRRRPSSAG